VDLPPDKVKVLKSYDDDKKWDMICDQVCLVILTLMSMSTADRVCLDMYLCASYCLQLLLFISYYYYYCSFHMLDTGKVCGPVNGPHNCNKGKTKLQ